MASLRQGLFITFEGPEGCGKSTQTYKLAEALRADGLDVVTTREPGGTAVGQQIREILLNPENASLVRKTEVLLFAADRVQHLEEKVRPALEQKKIVLCDRYLDSTTAYQIGGRGLDQGLIKEINHISTLGLMPQLTFLLDIPVDEGLKRATQQGKDRFEKEMLSFHEKVRQKYLELAARDKKRIKIIDGLGTIVAVHQEILQEARNFIKKYVN